MSGNNNAFTVYPDDTTVAKLHDYQGEDQSKTDAAEELINSGYEAEKRGLSDLFWWEAAKVVGISGIALLGTNAYLDLLTPILYYFGLTLVTASFLFMGVDRAIDRYDLDIRGVLGRGTATEEEAVHG